jgi:hypothetical protein
VAYRRRRDHDQVYALNYWRQMRAHEIRQRLFTLARFDQLDLAQLTKLYDRALRAGKKPDLETAQSEIGGRGASAVASAQHCDLFDGHGAE